MRKKYKFLEHTGDIKFQAEGKNLEEAFLNSALALNEVIRGNLKIDKKIKAKIKVDGKDKESLLLDFLEEFLFLLDAEDFLMSEVKDIKITREGRFKLEAEAIGDRASNYEFSNDVKAITYNEMFVKKTGTSKKGKVVVQVIVDV